MTAFRRRRREERDAEARNEAIFGRTKARHENLPVGPAPEEQTDAQMAREVRSGGLLAMFDLFGHLADAKATMGGVLSTVAATGGNRPRTEVSGREASLDLQSGTATIGRSTLVESPRRSGEDTKTSTSVDVGLTGVGGKRTTTTFTDNGHGKSTEDERTRGARVDFEEKKLVLTTGKSSAKTTSSRDRVTDEVSDDTTGSGSQTDYSIGKDGLGRARTDTVTEGGKTTERTSSIQVGKDGVALAAGKTHGEGDSAEGASARVALKKDEISAGADLTRGGVKVGLDVSMGGKRSAELRRLADGRIAVDYLVKSSRGAGASAGPLSGGHAESSTKTGTRIFDSVDEAKAFASSLQVMGAPAGGDSLEAVLRMKPGESLTSSGESGDKVGLGTSAGPIDVAVGATAGDQHSRRVAKIDDTHVEVEVETGESSGQSASFGGAKVLGSKISAGFSRDRSHGERKKVRFDLATPEGKLAYQQFQADPSRIPAAAEVVVATESDAEGRGRTIDLYAAHFASRKETGHRHGVDEEGQFDERTGKKSSSLGLFGDSLADAHGVTAIERDGKVSYVMTSQVSGSDAHDVEDVLAKSTGTHWSGGAKRSGSGKWSVSAEYSEEEMDLFFRRFQSGKGTVGSLIHGHGEAIAMPYKAIQAAGSDPAKRMEVIAKLVAEHGSRALGLIRENLPEELGGDPQRFDVRLEGDSRFGGRDARLALESQLAGMEETALLNTDNACMDWSDFEGRAADLFATLRARRRTITHDKLYTDLPPELREAEVKRLDGYLASLGAIRGQARANQWDAAGEQAPELMALRKQVSRLGSKTEVTRERLAAALDASRVERAHELRGGGADSLAAARRLFVQGENLQEESRQLQARQAAALADPAEAERLGKEAQARLTTALTLLSSASAQLHVAHELTPYKERKRVVLPEVSAHYAD